MFKDRLSGTEISFSQALFNFIDSKELTDVEVYKRAQIDRKLFSKLRKKGYVPKKKTIISLVFALELDFSETIYLLSLAGYTLSPSLDMPFDIIISNHIKRGIYDIDKVNDTLYEYELPLL